MNQEVIRCKLKQMMEEWGTTNKFVAQKTGISESQLCDFRAGRKVLGQERLRSLLEFLEERNYNC